jgi:hypothetical protein
MVLPSLLLQFPEEKGQIQDHSFPSLRFLHGLNPALEEKAKIPRLLFKFCGFERQSLGNLKKWGNAWIRLAGQGTRGKA